MHRSRDTIIKTTFHLFENMLDPTILNSISKTDKNLFLQALFNYSMDPNNGILQHKASLIHQLFRDRYSSNVFKEVYLKRYPDSKVDFIKDILMDFRVFGEFPVVRKYEETFPDGVKRILFTGDSIATTFDKQKQSNPDIIVDLESSYGIKRTYQDVKSGIVKHYTRGSLDLVTFDSNKQPIPFTSRDLTLYQNNKHRLSAIDDGLRHDNIDYTPFGNAIRDSRNILNEEPNIFVSHDKIQSLLWKEIQCHPKYNRSLAFTFIEHQDPIIITDRYTTFKNKFVSILSDKMYNTNNPGDRQEVFRAMLRSYREIDKDTGKKIEYMANELDFKIDKEFLHILVKLIKETLL